MDFEDMQKHLNNIKAMGFNVVWVNPFFKTSDCVVTRVDEYTGNKLSVKGSLYAMKNQNTYEYNINNDKIKAYTKEAQDLKITPIFDLVVNHIAKDSDLYKNNMAQFKQEQSMGWDDVIPFDYNTDSKRTWAFNYVWKPIIEKMISLGFKGVRIDYATGCNPDILKMCIDYLNKHIENPVLFGEALLPTSKLNELPKYKSTGFVNLTNGALFTTKDKILNQEKSTFRTDADIQQIIDTSGQFIQSQESPWFIKDLQAKRSILTESKLWRKGTIGFAGSHDHGTVLQAGAKESCATNIEIKNKMPQTVKSIKDILDGQQADSDVYIGWLKSCIKNIEDSIAGTITKEKLSSMDDASKMWWAKERIAIAAFSSDAGWCLMAGDEVLSEVSKRPFVRDNDEAFAGQQMEADDLQKLNMFSITDEMPKFIKSVNSLWVKLREAEKGYSCDISYIKHPEDSNRDVGLCFARYLDQNKSKIDVVIVRLDEASISFEKAKEQANKEFSVTENEDIKYYDLNSY